jgi:hypothetical protein
MSIIFMQAIIDFVLSDLKSSCKAISRFTSLRQAADTEGASEAYSSPTTWSICRCYDLVCPITAMTIIAQ